MKTVAIIGFAWLISQFVGLIVWAMICEWREPTRKPRLEVMGNKIV